MAEEWKISSCALCAQNCGLEVLVKDNRIVKVRGDKKNPRSKGYFCRKGANIANFQHHDDRLKVPLKRGPKGFEEISWKQATTEIAQKLKKIIAEHGPRAVAFMGGGGQGAHFEAGFSVAFLRLLGSRYHYNALAQELTGYYWVVGRMLGKQNRFPIPDKERADMLVAAGWNGMTSHQMPRAPLVLQEFSKNPDKLLAVIDPRKSETAKIANIHLALRPGTDALLVRAMIAIILENGWHDESYLKTRCKDFDRIKPWFENFDVRGALKVCGLDYQEVENLCRELGRRKWCLHLDLGVHMNRHGTLAEYLYGLLAAVCGRLCVPGGNVIPGVVMPLGSHSDERDPRTWRTVTTGYPAILGIFPPNVMPEEILSDHPERLRAVITCSSNPLRSYADTTAYEEAFKKLDLLVTVEMSMTETAELAHYVLPSRSAYECWDGTFFAWNFPEVYFQMRPPLLEPEADIPESSQVFTMLAEAMGMLSEIPGELYEAAHKDRMEFAAAFLSFGLRNRKKIDLMPFVLAKTLGKSLGSANLAALWGLFLSAPETLFKNAERAGFRRPSLASTLFNPSLLAKALRGAIKHRSPAPLAILAPRVQMAEKLFQRAVENPHGFWVGKTGLDNFKEIQTEDGKINLFIPELASWMEEIEPEREEEALRLPEEYPFILHAGLHKPENANTLMRKPDWNQGRRACTLLMNPEDADALGLEDGETVRVRTEAGSVEIELEVTERARKGQVLMPHGFGLKYKGKEFGANVNRLTKNTHRDRLAGTPYHRFIPCRVEKAGAGRDN